MLSQKWSMRLKYGSLTGMGTTAGGLFVLFIVLHKQLAARPIALLPSVSYFVICLITWLYCLYSDKKRQ